MDAPDQSKPSCKMSVQCCDKLGHCTRKMNEIEATMSENDDVDVIKGEVAEFHKILNDFKMYHGGLFKPCCPMMKMKIVIQTYQSIMNSWLK